MVKKRITRYCIEYWDRRGYSLEESKLKVNEARLIRAERMRKVVNPFSRQYWINQGDVIGRS